MTLKQQAKSPTPKGQTSDKTLICVDKDWGSTGIWILTDNQWTNANYESFPIPDWLRERFESWCNSYDSHIGTHCEFEADTWRNIAAYKLSLAIDLREALNDSYIVYIWDDDKNDRFEIHKGSMLASCPPAP